MNITPTQRLNTQNVQISGSSRTDPGKQEFLQLLVAELRNQDPLQPTQDKEFIAQLAQFNVLEQMQQLNSTIDAMAGLSLLTQGAALLGKWVDLSPQSSAGIAGGYVTEVDFSDQSMVLKVDGKSVRLGDIVSIKEKGDDKTA